VMGTFVVDAVIVSVEKVSRGASVT
jgi:hypothetical protein